MGDGGREEDEKGRIGAGNSGRETLQILKTLEPRTDGNRS